VSIRRDRNPSRGAGIARARSKVMVLNFHRVAGNGGIGFDLGPPIRF
jgi:hypothetical protein